MTLNQAFIKSLTDVPDIMVGRDKNAYQINTYFSENQIGALSMIKGFNVVNLPGKR